MLRNFTWLLMFLSFPLLANTYWPVPDGVRPATAAQTWLNKSPDVDFSGKGIIRGATSGREIGYASNGDISGNHSSACDNGSCLANPNLRLLAEPEFNAPGGATSINLKDRSGTLAGGIYKASGEVLLKSGDVLTVTAPSTLYADKFKVDGGDINVLSGNPDDLVIVAKKDAEITDGGTIYGHVFSKTELLLKSTSLYGTLVTNKLHIDEGGILNGQPPGPPIPPEPDIPEVCSIFPFATQSWQSASSSLLDFKGNGTVVGTKNTSGSVGFEQVNKAWDTQLACDGKECLASSSLLVSEPSLVTLNPNGPDITDDTAPIDAGYYNNISLGAGSSYTFTGGVYHIRDFQVGGGAEVTFSEPTTLVVNTLQFGGGSKVMVKDDLPENLVIWAEKYSGTDASVVLRLDNINPLDAHVFSRDTVLIDGSAKLQGKVTAKTVEISGSGHIVNTDNSCAVPEPEYDICHYIKEELQTTLYSGGSPSGSLHVDLTEAYDDYSFSRLVSLLATVEFFGWNNAMLFDPEVEDLYEDANIVRLPQSTRPLSFASFSNGTPYIGGCSYDDLTFFGWRNCRIDSFKSFIDLPAQLPAFQTGNTNFKCNKNESCSPAPGTYKNFDLKQNSTVTLSEGTYWIEHFDFDDKGASLRVTGPVQIHYKKLHVKKGPIYVNTSGAAEDLLFVGHGSDSRIEFDEDVEDSQIQAYFYVPPEADNHNSKARGFVVRGENNTIRGGVAAPHVAIGLDDDDTGNRFYGEIPPQCTLPPDDNYGLTLSPATGISLSCEAQRIEFQVIDADGNPTGSYTGSIRVDAPSGTTLTVVEGSGSAGVYQANASGLLSLDVTNAGIGAVDISGELTDSVNSTLVSASYTFVANKFEFNPSSALAIAGKPFETKIQPMECRTNDSGVKVPVVSGSFSGNKTVSLSTTNYIEPDASSVANAAAIQVKRQGDSDFTSLPNSSFDLNFTANDKGEAEASLEVRYLEAGQVSYTISATECIADDNGDSQCKTYSGNQTISVRPWTFAICSDENIEGTASSGDGYKATGSSFGVKVSPIVWQTGGSETEDVDTISYCSAAVTQNFFVGGAPPATVLMSHSVSSPSTGEGGVDGSLNGTLTMPHNAKSPAGNYFEFNDLQWTEVGSVRLGADTTGSYLGMDINLGYRSVGRFYPALFKVVDTSWQYPNTNDFAYMGQPFDGISFDVEAMGPGNAALQNYAHFNSVYQTRFNLEEDSSYASRFVTPSIDAGSWAIVASRSIGRFTNSKGTDCTDSICWNKSADFSPDGPFNQANGGAESKISLIAPTSNIDPVVYSTDGNVLTKQPDIRFGRIQLANVGGVQGDEIMVPLAIEYWNSSQFITNTDDVSSAFIGSRHCMQSIWPTGSNNASLSGSATVAAGESNKLIAKQTTSMREQVQFWLALDSDNLHCSSSGSSNLPWLRYNWDTSDNAEEDPSSVVTFGIFRGNDRVIFRGESGLIGQ